MNETEAVVDQTNLDNQTQTTSTEVKDSWDLIPEEIRKTSEIGRFEKGKAPELAKAYLELSKMDSGRVKIPDDKAKPEEWDKFFTKCGRPETPDKYQIKKPDIAGDDYSEEIVKKFAVDAHKAGYTNKQVQAAVDWQVKLGKELKEQQEQQIKQLNDTRWEKYKKEWGEVKTKENIELAKRAFVEVAPEELKELMTVDQIEQDPILVKMYSSFWRKTMDDTLIRGERPKIEEFKPQYPKSPEMYRNDQSEEGIKARKYFESQGYRY